MQITLDNFEQDQFYLKKSLKLNFFIRNKGKKKKCSSCGLYLCICQSIIIDWSEHKAKLNKNKCKICNLYLCDCPIDANGNKIINK